MADQDPAILTSMHDPSRPAINAISGEPEQSRQDQKRIDLTDEEAAFFATLAKKHGEPALAKKIEEQLGVRTRNVGYLGKVMTRGEAFLMVAGATIVVQTAVIGAYVLLRTRRENKRRQADRELLNQFDISITTKPDQSELPEMTEVVEAGANVVPFAPPIPTYAVGGS